MQIITPTQAGQTIDVAIGAIIKVVLTENRLPIGTSGHHWQWRLDVDGHAVVQDGEVQHDNHDTRPGLQGHLSVSYRGAEPGQSVLTATNQKVDADGNVLDSVAPLTFTFVVQ